MTASAPESATTLEVAAGVATITLNRPDNRNALSAELVDGLGDHLRRRRRRRRRPGRSCSPTPAPCSAPAPTSRPAAASPATAGRHLRGDPRLPQAGHRPHRRPLHGRRRRPGRRLRHLGRGRRRPHRLHRGPHRRGPRHHLGRVPAQDAPGRRRPSCSSRASASPPPGPSRWACSTGPCPPTTSTPRSTRWSPRWCAGGPLALAACKRLIAEVPDLDRAEAFAWTAALSAELFASDEAAAGIAAWRDKSDAPWIPHS